MSAVVLPFIGSNSGVNSNLKSSRGDSVVKLNSVRRKRMENLLFEVRLIKKLQEGFMDTENFLYERDLVDTDIESNEELFQSGKNPSSLSVVGVFESFYGTLTLDLSYTGKGYVDFCYCFNNPNIERCRCDFPKAHFIQSFGDNSGSLKQFEDYLKLFTLTGELHPCSFSKTRSAIVKDLRNPYCNEDFKGYPVKIVEPMLKHSAKEYFEKFGVYC